MDTQGTAGGAAGRAPGPVQLALGWLVHPVTVAATALLVVNDHVLKAAYPGWVTGKLSDVAGLVMAPAVVAVLLAVVVPWLRSGWQAGVAIGLVGVLFAAVKASPWVAAQASSAWSVVNGPSVVLADRTDLLTLPALLLAFAAWRQAAVRWSPRRWVRLLAVLVVLPTAGLAIAATAAPVYDDAVEILEWRDYVMVGIGNAYHAHSREARYWLASDDDGRTFHDLSDDDFQRFLDARPTLPRAGPRDCSAAQTRHCFRVVPGRLAVEESHDGGGTWQVAWGLSEAERIRLAGAYPNLGDPDEYLSSRALVVRERPDGVVVLVANGRDGFARRDTAGRWQRIGFGTVVADNRYVSRRPPEPVPGLNLRSVAASVPVPLVAATALAGIVIWVGCCAPLTRQGRTAAAKTSAAMLLPGLTLLVAGVAGQDQELIVFIAAVAGAGLTLSAVVVAVAAVGFAGVLTLAGVGRVVLSGVVSGTVAAAPFLARTAAGLPTDTVATVIALLVAGVVLTASVPLAIVHARHRRAGDPREAWPPAREV